MLTAFQLMERLQRPDGRVPAVLDTDTFNEIDDQYALSWMVKSPELFDLKAITAAPFFNEKSTGPADGMEKSYQEILHLLDLMARNDLAPLVHRGSTGYLPAADVPQDSAAAREIVRLANAQPEGKPLYIIAIGAITNVASALLIDPSIADKIVIVWLGGHALHWPDTREFNLFQDVYAARVVFDTIVPLVMLPCAGVVTHLTASVADLEAHLLGKNALCDYLATLTISESRQSNKLLSASRVIWDVSTIAWFFGDEYCRSRIVPSPIPTADGFWAQSETRHPIRYVYGINRDRILSRLFETLAQ